jgi:hypothetical protein
MMSDAERCIEFKKFKKIDDFTPLHMAVSERNQPAIVLQIQAGADPHLQTLIDDYETPREMAERAGLGEIAKLLAEYEARSGKLIKMEGALL